MPKKTEKYYLFNLLIVEHYWQKLATKFLNTTSPIW